VRAAAEAGSRAPAPEFGRRQIDAAVGSLPACCPPAGGPRLAHQQGGLRGRQGERAQLDPEGGQVACGRQGGAEELDG
jgi:hypothetical protein